MIGQRKPPPGPLTEITDLVAVQHQLMVRYAELHNTRHNDPSMIPESHWLLSEMVRLTQYLVDTHAPSYRGLDPADFIEAGYHALSVVPSEECELEAEQRMFFNKVIFDFQRPLNEYCKAVDAGYDPVPSHRVQ